MGGSSKTEKNHHEISSKFDDRFIVGCLFSRKFKIEAAVKMLTSNWEWRKEHGFEKIPEWSSMNKPLMMADFAVTVPGARTKNGLGIIYAKFGNMIPDDHPNFVEDIVNYMMWNNMIGIFLEDMDYHRNGICFVADMKSVGWKNIDTKLQKTVNSALMDKFPLKISQVLILHPPMILKPIMAGVRLLVKKKIMDRIQIIEPEEVLDYIDKSQLLSDFGGEVHFSIETYFDWVDKVLATNMEPKIHVKVTPKQKSHESYPRDKVPHLQLPKDGGEGDEARIGSLSDRISRKEREEKEAAAKDVEKAKAVHVNSKHRARVNSQ